MSAMHSFNYIFLVDDDPISVFLTQLILEETNIEGEVILASTITNALTSMQTHLLDKGIEGKQKPSLLLMETNLADMDNYAFVEQVQKWRQIYPMSLQVAILSTSTYVREKEKMDTFGIKHFLAKPLTKEKLLSFLIAEDNVFAHRISDHTTT